MKKLRVFFVSLALTLSAGYAYAQSFGIPSTVQNLNVRNTLTVDGQSPALLDTENLFTVPQFISMNTPQLWLNVNTNPADERAWFVGADAGGLTIGTSNDAASALNHGISMSRASGSPVVTGIEIQASAQILLDGFTQIQGITAIIADSANPLRLFGSDLTPDATLNYVTIETGVGGSGAYGYIGDYSGADIVGIRAITGSAEISTASDEYFRMADTGVITFSDNTPVLIFDDNDAASNERLWRINAGAGSFILDTRTDAGGAGDAAIVAARTGTNVDSINITADDVTINSQTAATISNGSFSPTWSGFSTAPTQAIQYSVSGEVACLSMGGATNQGTSNSTLFSLSGIPTVARPTTFAVRTACRLTDSGTTVNGMCRVTTGGGITFGVDNLTSPNGGNDWTGSGTKGLAGSDWMLCYPTN